MLLTKHTARAWQDTGIPGIQTCSTWTGEGDGGYFTKFESGARFPHHGHELWEQSLVVSGAIQFNDDVLRTGDVLQVGAEDQHEALALEDTLLFVAYRGSIHFTS